MQETKESVILKIAGIKEARQKLIEKNLPDVAKMLDADLLGLEVKLKSFNSEKKNDLANSSVEPSAVATSADARQQSSATSPKSEGANLDVGVHSNGDSSNDILEKKWVGKAHKDSFLSAKAFERFMKVKHKLKTLIVNFLKLEDTEINDASKKNTMIDLSRELTRIVNNDVKKEYKKDLLERKFFVRKGKNKVFYGCDEKLIDNIFKTK